MIKFETPTVKRNNSNKYYTKLDNDTLRMKIEGDPITAKDIWLDSLTCRDSWLFTTPNIATRHDIHPKKAQRLLTRLVNSGLAERRTITDPATGKIILHHYIFHESPVDKKRPVDKIKKDTENKEKTNKLSSGQKVSSVSIKNKHKEKTTTPLTPLHCEPPKLPPDSKAAVVVVSEFEILKNRLRDDLKPSFVDRTYRVLLDKGLSIGRMKTLIDEMNDSSARTCGWLMARVKDLEDPAAIPDADEIAEQERIRAEAARKRHDERMAKLKVVSEKDNEDSGRKIEKHIETYTNLSDEYKQLVFALVLHKSRGEERKKRIMDAGADGLHEVENIGYRIQAAMKQMNMPGKGNPGRKDDEVR